MPAAALVKAYENGELKDKLTYYGRIEKDGLSEQALLLADLYHNGKLESVKLLEPDQLPAVQAKKKAWYGLYYDDNGNIQSQILHSERSSVHILMDNDDLNSIYEWIQASFARKTMD